MSKLFTCQGKGGEYAVVGTSNGAGPRKGEPLIIYKDTTTGQLFHREPENFFKRMQAVGDTELQDRMKKLLEAAEGVAGYLAGGHYEPRNEQEAEAASALIKAVAFAKGENI